MSTPKILLGILVVLPAAVLLARSASASEPAAQECKLKPGLPGPPGTHWYYRINRADKRHCWYLGSLRQGVSHAHEAVAREVSPSPISSSPAPRREDAAAATDAAPSPAAHSANEPMQAAPVHVASAATASITPTIQQQSPGMDFDARWPDLPKAVDLSSYGGQSARLSSYADKDEATAMAEQMPRQWPVASSQHAALSQRATGHAAIGSVSLAAALVMVSLLLGGGVLKLARQPQPRPAPIRDHRWSAEAGLPSWLRTMRAKRVARTDTKPAVAKRRNNSILRVSMPTDPAQDLKTSLRELMGDLERAGAAANDPDRSFAPAGRQMQMATATPELSKVSRFAGRKRAAVPTVDAPPLQSGKFA
jgi:hypothetical protein